MVWNLPKQISNQLSITYLFIYLFIYLFNFMIALLLQYYASRLKVVSTNRHIKQRQYSTCQMIDESSKAREKNSTCPPVVNSPSLVNSVLDPAHTVTAWLSSRCFFSKSVWWNRYVTRPACRYVRSRKTSWFDEVIGLERLTSCPLGIANKSSLLLFIYFFCVWRSFNLMRTETGRYQIYPNRIWSR